ncbi:MAG: ATP-dependent DNA helicase RecQ [bacterium]
MNIYEALKHYYGYDSYRSNQADIITSLVNNENTIAILPTGGGKSVCFQIPSLLKEGLCIVITPLISLMSDQVYEIKKMNIKATLVNSTMDKKQIDDIYNNLSEYKFLYLSPERLENKLFLEKVKKIKLSYIIIDEAHCIQTWGSVFRNSYQRISNFTKLFNVPIGCFTATSTKYTLNKIVETLSLNKYNLFQTSLSRNNLMFSIIKTNNKLEVLKKYLNLDGVKIIYCSTVKCVENLYNLLNGYKVTKYHGRLDQEQRTKNQDDFIKGKIDLIIATNAFGMGINKSNVRYVIHYEVSSSIEDYYQEAGRAGRDNLSSKCIILFDINDFKVHYYQRDLLTDKAVKTKKTKEIESLKKYINTKECLEVAMKSYFSEKSNKCYKCINCLKSNPLIDVSKILLDFDNIKENYNISNNNYFLLEEHLNLLKNKYSKYKLFLKENRYKVSLIYNKDLEKQLKKLNLNKNKIIEIIYLNPKKNSSKVKENLEKFGI